jgi:hypothetical protein
MKIQFDKLENVANQISREFEVMDGDNCIYLRFGYWDRLAIEKFKSLKETFSRFIINEILVDDDDDCGTLWMYQIKD